MSRRAYSFHKSYLAPELRAQNARLWAEEWNGVEGAELCARIILTVHRRLFGKHWTNGERPKTFSDAGPALSPALNVLAKYKIRSLPETAARGLLRWAAGEIELRLFRQMPSVQEILHLQTQGIRCVSVLISSSEIAGFQHEDRDFYSFMIHDLVHAQLMTADHENFVHQIRFARWLEHEWPALTVGLSASARRELEYMAADMNSHMVHLLKTFKSWVERFRPELLLHEDWFFQRQWRLLNHIDGEEADRLHRALLQLWTERMPASDFKGLAP